MKILCKVTSRERPTELIKCIDSYIQLADNPNDLLWLFTFDDNDVAYNNQQLIHLIHSKIHAPIINFGISKSKISAINRDVNQLNVSWDILVNISDDQLAERKGWDSIIKNTMPEDLDASLWFNDGHQDRINTMEIVGRKYYERFNYIYHYAYKSFFCDNEATEVAIKLGKCIKSNDCIIKHYHYGWMPSGHMKKDAVYTNAELHWNHDKQLFKERKAINYEL